MQELLQKVIALLESGDDEGCDDLVVVDKEKFLAAREVVKDLTGAYYGSPNEQAVSLDFYKQELRVPVNPDRIEGPKMIIRFGWEHIFAGEPLGLVVEFDVAAKRVVTAWTHSTKRFLGVEELADLNESIGHNIDLEGGWERFVKDLVVVSTLDS